MQLFMIFRYEGEDKPWSFRYVVSEKAFITFVTGNQPNAVKFAEEDVTFPPHLLSGDTRRALVHYNEAGSRFACYVPVFPTEAELDEYDKAFR